MKKFMDERSGSFCELNFCIIIMIKNYVFYRRKLGNICT
jgi:hypothetical protein